MSSGLFGYKRVPVNGLVWMWGAGFTLTFVVLFSIVGCGKQPQVTAPGNAGNHPIPYQYQETRALVSLVDAAAKLVAKNGSKAFPKFAERGSQWFHDSLYVFVYNAKGVCIFHPVTPDLIGQDLINLHDFDGKPIVKRVVSLTQEPGPSPSGWFFYLWQDGPQLQTVWKSAYVRAVVTPAGQHWVVGAGLYNLRVEREFIRERVNQAAQLIKQKGRKVAFKAFKDPASPFVFLGTYIFVLDMQGNAVVDPAFPTHGGRSLLAFKDAVGKPVIKMILAKMRKQETAWVQYKWPRPGMHVLGRKVVYLRKVKTPQGTVIVGAQTFMASPIWMRG